MDHNQLDGGRRVEIMYPFVQSTSVWRRHVEVTHRESPLLVMTMQHRTKVKNCLKNETFSVIFKHCTIFESF